LQGGWHRVVPSVAFVGQHLASPVSRG
jgi:hypothetical protein